MWQPSQESEEPKTISSKGWGEGLSKLNISSQSKVQCWFRKRKTELKIIEETKICIPAMLKPYSASSFCLPNKNRVGVAHGDGTNLEVVYSWTCCTTAMTCQGPRIHLSGPATWKWALLGTTLKKIKEEEATSVTKRKKQKMKMGNDGKCTGW